MKKDLCALFERGLEKSELFAGPRTDGADGSDGRALTRARLALHGVVCETCARKKRRAALAGGLLKTAFLPPSPAREDAVMAALLAEEAEAAKERACCVSTRGWIAAGVLIVVSLISVYFNVDFPEFARAQGMPYLLPLGITVGAVITAYGALFIGTHIDMLREKFGME